MSLLSQEDQQKVITQYQKDYGRLILEYNKCNSNINSLLSIKNKAESLCSEIQQSASFHKKFFSEENMNFAEIMVKEIEKFMNNYLDITAPRNISLVRFNTNYDDYIENFVS